MIFLNYSLRSDHLTLEGEGGRGVGDFEKKLPGTACWKKKIASSTNEIEKKNILLCFKQEKNVAKIFHQYLGALQNPSKATTIPDDLQANEPTIN